MWNLYCDNGFVKHVGVGIMLRGSLTWSVAVL